MTTNRITDKFLQSVCDRINRMQGAPLEPYAKDESGKYQPQAGNYHLDHAYGGVALYRMCNQGTGTDDVLRGHVSKRELANRMFAFIAGLEARK